MWGALLWDTQAERMVTLHLWGLLPHLGYAATWRGTYSRNSQIGRVSQHSARDLTAQSRFATAIRFLNTLEAVDGSVVHISTENLH